LNIAARKGATKISGAELAEAPINVEATFFILKLFFYFFITKFIVMLQHQA